MGGVHNIVCSLTHNNKQEPILEDATQNAHSTDDKSDNPTCDVNSTSTSNIAASDSFKV